MLAFPHVYTAAATVHPGGDALVASPHLTTLHSAPPADFGGSGDRWSPETLFVAAVADCFVLTFRAIANASHLSWQSLTCEVSGQMDQAQDGARFTEFRIRARLGVPDAGLLDKANTLITRTERSCVITRSLKAPARLEAEVFVDDAAAWDPAV
jgi:organic hydroperoxide reductase OsmC/OhrA